MLYKTLPNWLTRMMGVFAVVALLAGCASSEDDAVAEAAYEEANDPLEGLNRYIFEVNLGLDKLLFRPLAEVYRAALPDIVQDVVRNFLNNLRTPVILFNDLMQGELDRAWTTTARFGINSTVGVLGLWDFATDWGFPRHDEDFGQTLAVWGVGDGPYLMLPLLGPSNARDALGRVVDYVIDPWSWFIPEDGIGALAGTDGVCDVCDTMRSGLDALDARARNIEAIDDLERNSLDFYATVRSLYRQRRQDQIRNGEPSANIPVPSISQTSEVPGLTAPNVPTISGQ